MRITLTVLLLIACAYTYGQDSAQEAKEPQTTTKTTERIKERKTARLYRRANSRIKKELHFITKSDIKTA